MTVLDVRHDRRFSSCDCCDLYVLTGSLVHILTDRLDEGWLCRRCVGRH